VRNIDVVILCGGLGTRLRSVTGAMPKVMVEVDGQPFLDVILKYLKQQGFRRVILCTGYQAEMVEVYYRERSHGLAIEFSKEEEPLGTGGALKNAQHLIQSNPFFVLNGDSFCALNFKDFLEFYQSKPMAAALAISKVEESKDCGGIVLDQTERITGFYEKEAKNNWEYVNAGVYCLSKDIFSLMSGEKKCSMEYDVFPRLVEKETYGFLVEKKFLDIGTPERLVQAKANLRKED